MAPGLAIPESDLLANVIKAARLAGWRTAHFRPAMTKRGRWVTAVQGDGKGFPDLVLAHPKKKRVLVLELKSATGRVTPEQADWLALFTACGIQTRVVRPSDFDDLWVELNLP